MGLKRFIRTSLGKVFKNDIDKYIESRITKSSTLDNVDYRLKRLNELLMDIYPDIFVITPQEERKIRSYLKDKGWTEKLNLSISKNDSMFHAILYFKKGDFSEALVSYFRDGIQSMEMVEKILGDVGLRLSDIGLFLDFASGYGKFTRYLIHKIDPDNVWVSDVKLGGINFQQKHFGVNALPSYFDPDKFKPEQDFEFIFVGSLFSHLPRKLFEQWLVKLYQVLAKDGFLAFSTHDMSLLNDSLPEDFVYLEDNEDLLIEKVADNITDTSVYGTTYVRESLMRDMFEDLLGVKDCKYYPKGLWRGQDVYVLKKKYRNIVNLKLSKGMAKGSYSNHQEVVSELDAESIDKYLKQLGISKKSSESELKRIFKSLAKRFKYRRITYKQLSDAANRVFYGYFKPDDFNDDELRDFLDDASELEYYTKYRPGSKRLIKIITAIKDFSN